MDEARSGDRVGAAHTMEVLPVDLGPGVRAFFTTNRGGCSTGPWASLNLSWGVGDASDAVRANRATLQAYLGAPVATVRQVHQANVHVVRGLNPAETGQRGATATTLVADPALWGEESEDQLEADALVTSRAGVGLAVMVADCVPILLADAQHGVVAAVHAGRRGVVHGVLPQAVAAVRHAGARSLRAVVGPCICARCYEVGTAVRAEVEARVPGAGSTTRWGTAGVDLRRAVHSQLEALAVERVTDVALCTREDPRLYSHRGAVLAAGSGKKAVTGRFAGVVALDQG